MLPFSRLNKCNPKPIEISGDMYKLTPDLFTCKNFQHVKCHQLVRNSNHRY